MGQVITLCEERPEPILVQLASIQTNSECRTRSVLLRVFKPGFLEIRTFMVARAVFDGRW